MQNRKNKMYKTNIIVFWGSLVFVCLGPVTWAGDVSQKTIGDTEVASIIIETLFEKQDQEIANGFNGVQKCLALLAVINAATKKDVVEQTVISKVIMDHFSSSVLQMKYTQEDMSVVFFSELSRHIREGVLGNVMEFSVRDQDEDQFRFALFLGSFIEDGEARFHSVFLPTLWAIRFNHENWKDMADSREALIDALNQSVQFSYWKYPRFMLQCRLELDVPIAADTIATSYFYTNDKGKEEVDWLLNQVAEKEGFVTSVKDQMTKIWGETTATVNLSSFLDRLAHLVALQQRYQLSEATEEHIQ